MPPPSPKVLKTLRDLADLRWQAERADLALASRATAAREAEIAALAVAREAEREVLRETPDFNAAAAGQRYEKWAKREARRRDAMRDHAAENEEKTRLRAIEALGRVRALDHLGERAKTERERLRRAARERDGQPPD